MKTHLSWDKNAWIILVLAVVNIVIHLLVSTNLEYHRDELLYFSLGLHPAFGYNTVPPLIGWIATVMQTLFGFSVFAVKLFPAVMSGVMLLLATAITRELGGKTYAQILTALAIILMPCTMRTFHLFQPVHLDMLLWSAIFYYVLRYINTSKDSYLIIMGAFFGLAMLNKYMIGLLVIALFVPLFFSGYREVFRKKAFYKGLGLGFLIFLPNLLWQLSKKLPVITHMKALNESQLVHVDRMSFLIDQLEMTLPAFFLFLLGFVLLLKTKRYRILFFSVIIVYVLLLLLKGKSYYTLGLIPFLVAAGAVLVEQGIKNNFLRVVLPILMILITLPMLPFGLPIYKQDGMVAYFKKLEDKYDLTIGRTFEDGTLHSLPQDYADQLGWQELTEITAKAYAQIPDKKGALIYAENYGQAGAIAVIGKKYKLPEPVSFNESFQYWVPLHFEYLITDFIYINDDLGEDVEALFQQIELVGSITNPNAREFGTRVYLCKKPRMDFETLWKHALEREEIPTE